jgi:hypothetical protein
MADVPSFWVGRPAFNNMLSELMVCGKSGCRFFSRLENTTTYRHTKTHKGRESQRESITVLHGMYLDNIQPMNLPMCIKSEEIAVFFWLFPDLCPGQLGKVIFSAAPVPEIEDEEDEDDEDDEEEEAVAIDAQLTVINACLFASVVSQILCLSCFLCTHSSLCAFVQLYLLKQIAVQR